MWRWLCESIYFGHCWHWYDEEIETETTPKGCNGPRRFMSWDSHSGCCHCPVIRSGMQHCEDSYVYFKVKPEVRR